MSMPATYAEAARLANELNDLVRTLNPNDHLSGPRPSFDLVTNLEVIHEQAQDLVDRLEHARDELPAAPVLNKNAAALLEQPAA